MSSIPSTWGLLVHRPATRGISVTVGVCALVLFVCMVAVFGTTPQASALHFGGRNLFDTVIASHLNHFVGRAPWFDSMMGLFAEHNLLKGAPIVLLCWGAFFEKNRSQDLNEGRSKLVSVIPVAMASVLVARVLAVILPFSERPFRSTAFPFRMPQGTALVSLYSWSSFPSDHAALFMALAVGAFFASRRLGSVAIAYVALFIIGPRAYLGIHWPTDLLAGAALGTAFAAIAEVQAYRDFIWKWANKCWQSSPGAVAASLFLLSYEITDLFATPIAIASMVLKHKHH
jgi:membrane-associated phospholipid phosphatase